MDRRRNYQRLSGKVPGQLEVPFSKSRRDKSAFSLFVEFLIATSVDMRAGLGRVFGLLGGLCAGLILSTVASASARETSGTKVTYASGPEVMAMFVKRGRINYPWMARRQYKTGSGIFECISTRTGR
jgi:hypothetical protein